MVFEVLHGDVSMFFGNTHNTENNNLKLSNLLVILIVTSLDLCIYSFTLI